MPTLTSWLQERTTPICWIAGASEHARSIATNVLWLSKTNPDRCLREMLGTAGPVTTAQLFARFDAATTEELVLLDGLDALQDESGTILDLRLRHFLSAAARRKWPTLGVIVTSEVPPPRDLQPRGVSVIGSPRGEGATRRARSHDADALRKAQQTDDPDLRRELLEEAVLHSLEIHDFENAASHYWQSLGNFSQLSRENAMHLGARVCRALNGGRDPHEISPALRQFAGGLAVMNDWTLYATCTGDARLASEAAEAACELSPRDMAPWDSSMIARHRAEALLRLGRIPEAMRWTERAIEHARDGLRANQGMPSSEVMEAFDEAFIVLMQITSMTKTADAAVRVLEDLVEIHERAREKLAQFNRNAVVPLQGPEGDVDPAQLADGLPAAIAALVSGRPADAMRILATRLSSRAWASPGRRFELRALLVRAQLANGDGDEARDAIAELQRIADDRDDTAARCEAAQLAAEVKLAQGDAARACALLEDALDLAANGSLGLHRIDLLGVHSRALLALGRAEAAKASADAALLRAADPDCDYRNGGRTAAAALQAAGGEVPERVLASLTPAEGPPPKKRRRVRSAKATETGEVQRRAELHDAALAVIDDYETRGMPFALYFRKFDFLILHGPSEFGTELIENVLDDAMPDGAHVLTIQSHDDLIEYQGGDLPFHRAAPALLLEDEHWEKVAAWLIPHADLIVSECSMLTYGVRFELDRAFRAGRWDRTVLVLPPQRGPFPLVDSHELIQMFPRCIWADSLHRESLVDSFVVKDLIARMESIAALPEGERRKLTDPAARDAAFPIDLLPIAERYEFNATISAQWEDEDDRVRYYGFWQLFRATSIRAVQMMRGDDSFANRLHMSSSYTQMSAILLDHEKEGDRIVLVGDLTFAEQCAQSAINLMYESDGYGGRVMRLQAEQQWQQVRRLRQAMEADPERFILRPRYGPFPVSVMPREE